MAHEVDGLYLFILWFSILGTIFVGVFTTYLAVRYRRRSADETPEQPKDSDKMDITSMVFPAPAHESSSLEIIVSLLLFVSTMVMFGWGAKVFVKLSHAPADAMEVLVTGKQWMWKLQHPSGKREINELHVPLGQPVKLTMTSEDVIHSFFVPAFRVKQDVVPGRYTQLWFTPTKLGDYNLFCAQYCGTDHSKMTGWIHVVTPAEYQQWLKGAAANGPQLSPEEAGKALFTAKGCLVCHNPDVPVTLGPKLAGVWGSKVKLMDGSEVLADEDYMRESILNSQAKIVLGFPPVMPLFKGTISEEEVMQLLAYLKTLKAVGTK